MLNHDIVQHRHREVIHISAKDLTGKQFEFWTVLRAAESATRDKRWQCRCNCGTERSVLGKYLLSGKSKSCGCSKMQAAENKATSLLGKKFGKLTVTEILDTVEKQSGDRKRRLTIVRCLCDCGKIHITNGRKIERISSCGCGDRVPSSHVGETFGRLTVIEMLYSYKDKATWCRCSCECGNKDYITRFTGLKTGNTASCGCIQSPCLIGRRFGRLVVTEEIESLTPQRKWRCVCDCGQTRNINSYTLTSGHTSSCGCLRNERVSIKERCISSYLTRHSVQHITEMTFEDCVGVNGWVLRFDFYIPHLNTLIEYDGIQHFQPVEYFGGIVSHKKQITNDEIKNRYCIEKNIRLVRLPYTLSVEEIEVKLKEIVFENPVTTTVA